MVAYRLIPQMGRPVVAEVRVYPGTPDTYVNPGEWSAECEGSQASVPTGGITARLLSKHLKVGTYLSHFATIIRKTERQWGRGWVYGDQRYLGRHGFTPVAAETDTTVGRPPLHDLTFYARLARDLRRIENQDNAKAPVKQLVHQMNQSVPRGQTRYDLPKMYRLVHVARDKGMLGPAQTGFSGGILTERARALLRAAGEDET
jgi:hypothetical protein